MTALADVQRALNAIRGITKQEQAAVRLEVLRLLASTIADEAREIEGVKVQNVKRFKRPPQLPIPKSKNTPKPRHEISKIVQSTRHFQSTKPVPPNAPI